jgi:hypothetical protein
MGIDGGGQGGTSNGYDHLGYSVLMNTYDGMATADKVPTLLTPRMIYNGETIDHNELGGLTNTFVVNYNTCVAKGGTVTLMPQLPAGETNTGLWQWNTGETTREITVNTDWSYVYRVTYTNARGIQSCLAFFIATTDKGVPVGIEGPTASSFQNKSEANALYDLSGRKLKKASRHSIVVSNGKKIYNP